MGALLEVPQAEVRTLGTWSLKGKNLSFAEVQQDLSLILGRAQEKLPSLTRLDVGGCTLGDAGLGVLAAGIGPNTQLRHLGVGDNAITVEGAGALADALRVNTTLTSLDVRGRDWDGEDDVDSATINAAAASGQKVDRKKEHAALGVLGSALLANRQSAVCFVMCDAFTLDEQATRLMLDKEDDNGRPVSAGAATLLAGAVRANKVLVDLSVRHCPLVVGEAARQLAASVLESTVMCDFSKLPLEELRGNYPGLVRSDAHHRDGLVQRRNDKKPMVTLKVANAGMGAAGAIVAAGAAAKVPTLTTVALPNNKIGTEGGVAMAALLRGVNGLTNLDLRGGEIVGEGARALADAVLASSSLETFSEVPLKRLRENTGDERLDLTNSGGSLSPAEAHVLASLLADNTKVTALVLDRNHVLNEGAISLLKMLHTNSTLTSLVLNETELTAGAVPAIAEMLVANSTLRELNIGGNKLGKEAGGLLADAIEKNKTLTSLRALRAIPTKEADRLKKARATRTDGQPTLEVKV